MAALASVVYCVYGAFHLDPNVDVKLDVDASLRIGAFPDVRDPRALG